MFALSSSLRIPDPYLLLKNPRSPLSSGTPRLINLPRNWLSQQHTVKQPMGQKCVCVCVHPIGVCVMYTDGGIFVLRNWLMLLLQEILKDRERWCAAVRGVTKSQRWLSDWTTKLSGLGNLNSADQAVAWRPREELMLQPRSGAEFSLLRGALVFSLKAINWLEETHPHFKESSALLSRFSSVRLCATP